MSNRIDYVEIKGKIKFKAWLKNNPKMRFELAIQFEEINAITINCFIYKNGGENISYF